ncbi:LOW QUALITY PROTEIN: transmembrane protein 132C [Aplochiton taeniatus]
MLHMIAIQSIVVLLGVVDCRVLEGLQRFSSTPTYLPVNYQVLHAKQAFFLKEANQDIMRNSSLLSRTEPFFIYQARSQPSVNASYGPLSVEQPVPLELIQGPWTFPASSSSSSSSASSSSLFTFNWKIQTFIVNDRIHLTKPKVQVLFYVGGRDWDDYSAIQRLPCVRMFAFHETQEVRGTCRLKGELGLCVAELEPLAGWFSPPSMVPGRLRGGEQQPAPQEGTPVELYYMLQSMESAGECHADEVARRGGNSIRSEQEGLFGSATSTPLRRIGSVRLYQSPTPLALAGHRLDNNFVVLVPASPVRQRDTLSAFITVSAFSPVEIFTLRVKLKEGVTFLGARPSNPALWMVSQEVRSEGYRVVTLHCRRKETIYGQRSEGGLQRVLQADLKVESLPGDAAATGSGQGSSRWIAWQVEYPGSRSSSPEAETEIRLAQENLGGIVPLAMDSEILNTAVLTGKTVAVPVKVVTVSSDGTVTDVSEAVRCRSTDEDVVKVSDRCDYVFVNGKETKGKVKMTVNFTYSYLVAQLELNVWIPRLPLQIEVSDTELSQIKGWRVPIAASTQRSTRDSEDEDEEDRRGRPCTLQYQSAMVRVMTHFVAEGLDPRGQLTHLLGSDWQVDITELVWDFLKVEDPQVVRLLDGRILVGLDIGMTTIQVLSPLSDSILAEKTVTVVDDKVTITELGVQLVTGLSLSLQLSPGSNRAVLATATTQEVLQSPKQEALLSAWLQFSDGSMAPLDLYDPDVFVLMATSLDEDVVSVRQDPSWKWPLVVTEAEGQGLLVRVEMTVCEACQKFKRRSVLAAGNCNVRVKFDRGEGDRDGSRGPGGASDYGEDVENRSSDGRQLSPSQDTDEGVRRRPTTTKSALTRRPVAADNHDHDPLDDKLSDDGDNFSDDFPSQVDLPGGGGGGGGGGQAGTEDELIQAARGLTDLEIGMYALLGVFCLAILVFLINCISYTLKYRHKELSVEGGESLNHHAHDWVWLGNEAELLESHALGLASPLAGGEGLHAAALSAGSAGLEEGSHLLNGGPSASASVSSAQRNVQGQVHRADEGAAGSGKDSKGDSPTTKRKRVKFTTFTTTIPPDNGCPVVSHLDPGPGPCQDIKWVCQDVEMGNSKELRNYMERLSDSALKEAA